MVILNFIPVGGKFPAHKIKRQVVEEYRQHEREKMHKCLDDYMTVCSELKVQFTFLVKFVIFLKHKLSLKKILET